MLIAIIVFLFILISGIREFLNSRDGEYMVFGFVVALVTFAFVMVVAGIFTTTNYNEYYTYQPLEVELTPLEGKYVALDGAKIYYIGNGEIRTIDTGHAYVKTDNNARAIYYKYCGFNKENIWRLIYTLPSGASYIEFYIPDGAIAALK